MTEDMKTTDRTHLSVKEHHKPVFDYTRLSKISLLLLQFANCCQHYDTLIGNYCATCPLSFYCVMILNIVQLGSIILLQQLIALSI
jgi:hypothetical protein